MFSPNHVLLKALIDLILAIIKVRNPSWNLSSTALHGYYRHKSSLRSNNGGFEAFDHLKWTHGQIQSSRMVFCKFLFKINCWSGCWWFLNCLFQKRTSCFGGKGNENLRRKMGILGRFSEGITDNFENYWEFLYKKIDES